MRASRTRRVFSYLLLSGGALLVFFGGRDVVESQLGQYQARHQFEAPEPPKPSPFHNQAKPNLQSAPKPNAVKPPVGDAIARLTIPRLGTDLYVVEGDGTQQLRLGPGHLRGTAMPGENGNCIIAGHRDTHFRALKEIQPGDEIKLQTRDGEYTYRVGGLQVVSPDYTAPLRPTTDAELHLVTCYPFYYLGSAPKRFIVEAQLENSTASITPASFAHAPQHPARPRHHAASPSVHVRSSRKMY